MNRHIIIFFHHKPVKCGGSNLDPVISRNLIFIMEGLDFIRWDQSRQVKVMEGLQAKHHHQDEDVHLLWHVFKAKDHWKQVESHKQFVIQTYDRFQACFPTVSLDQVRSHDDSKLTFVEILGYTDKWVHQRHTQCWELGLSHHP